MKKLCTLLLTLAIVNILSAQSSLIKKWDYRYGGTNDDFISWIINTSDGGFLLGGSSNSGISGDKTENIWGEPWGDDYWIIKLSSDGEIVWDKNLGGFYDDNLIAGIQTRDGGYLLGGTSYSDAGGDKTEDNLSLAPWVDFWIVKTDGNGNKQWDATLGGVFNESLSAIQQTADGGYILGGSSDSPAGDDKSEDTRGETGHKDYWIVRIDSVGNKMWDKTIGGDDEDILTSLQQTTDGGYLLGGYTSSNTGFDKTQDLWGGDGDVDYWVVRIDAFGNILWDKDLGGTGSDYLIRVLATSDDEYILGGISTSEVGGDKTQPIWGDSMYYDLWVLKLDQFGEKIWDRSFGGAKAENILSSLEQSKDGGYLIGGTSYSGIDGDKTEENLGLEQSWILKIDNEGHKQWDKTLHTNGHDEVGFVIQTLDDCYLMANSTSAGIGGDKSQANWDTTQLTISPDYWIVKFCESGTTGTINHESIQSYTKTDPNPFSDRISISFLNADCKDGSISLINAVGESVYFERFENNSIPINKVIDVPFLPSGIYFLYLNIDGHPIVKKMVKL